MLWIVSADAADNNLEFFCLHPDLRYITVDLRHLHPSTTPPNRPHVAIIVDGSRSYSRDVLRGVTNYANINRKWILFKDTNLLLSLKSDWPQFDAAIFSGGTSELFQLGLKNCPRIVLCSGNGDPEVSPVVCQDDYRIGEQAAEHLIDCRLSRFAYYGHNQYFKPSQNRQAGFIKTIEAHGLECIPCPLPHLSEIQYTEHAHRPALIQWLSQLAKPIGIFAFDDNSASDLSEACLEANIDVPNDVAILGANNDDLLCDSAWPPLSSVEADHVRCGYEAAKLIDRMIGGETLSNEDRYLRLPPLGVVKRQSTNILAIEDRNLAAAVRYIRDHACDPCSVDDILEAVPVSRRWLERQFKIHLNRTPYDEIVRVRIEIAKRYLARPDISLAEIVNRCGYASDTNFHRTFRQLVGLTPAAFRRSIKNTSTF